MVHFVLTSFFVEHEANASCEPAENLAKSRKIVYGTYHFCEIWLSPGNLFMAHTIFPKIRLSPRSYVMKLTTSNAFLRHFPASKTKMNAYFLISGCFCFFWYHFYQNLNFWYENIKKIDIEILVLIWFSDVPGTRNKHLKRCVMWLRGSK